ncbi:MAG: GtrA family protein [Bacteroidales bacterium]|nr:GtrA family protein [Bacteroidales bacterium]MBK9358220.1 GtrA family protein [Bacteroidales bacterium]
MAGIRFSDKSKRLFLQLIKFGIAGLPSFLVAIPLNWFLVEEILLLKPIAYLITLFFQVTVNFILLRLFVFKGEKNESAVKLYFQFLWGIAFFRLLDWGLYTLLVQNTKIYYLIIQIGNVVIFSLAKFFYSKKIMER